MEPRVRKSGAALPDVGRAQPPAPAPRQLTPRALAAPKHSDCLVPLPASVKYLGSNKMGRSLAHSTGPPRLTTCLFNDHSDLRPVLQRGEPLCPPFSPRSVSTRGRKRPQSRETAARLSGKPPASAPPPSLLRGCILSGQLPYFVRECGVTWYVLSNTYPMAPGRTTKHPPLGSLLLNQFA